MVKCTKALLIALLASLVFVRSSTAVASQYGWTISDSIVSPTSNSGAPAGGLITLYLWYVCSGDLGIAAAEFDFTASPLAPAVGMNGWVNLGTHPTQWLATIAHCPDGPMVAATLQFMDTAGINVCIRPSAENGVNASLDCEQVAYQQDFIGYDSTGDGFCKLNDGWDMCLIAVEPTSWGSIKTLYR